MSFNLNSVLDISGSSMSAQSGRLNTIAAVMRETGHMIYPPEDEAVGVQIVGIVESDAPSIGVYKPDHPLADKDGMVYGSNVNVMEEMADMISASRAYQDSVMVATTGQELLLRTLDLLR
jgi:flagellar basal-body rod protein FlgC